MGFFKNLFKKKEKESDENIVTSLPTDAEFAIPITHGGLICDYCQEEILEHEPRKKFTGKPFHIKCFRTMKKDAKKFAYQ